MRCSLLARCTNFGKGGCGYWMPCASRILEVAGLMWRFVEGCCGVGLKRCCGMGGCCDGLSGGVLEPFRSSVLLMERGKGLALAGGHDVSLDRQCDPFGRCCRCAHSGCRVSGAEAKKGKSHAQGSRSTTEYLAGWRYAQASKKRAEGERRREGKMRQHRVMSLAGATKKRGKGREQERNRAPKVARGMAREDS